MSSFKALQREAIAVHNACSCSLFFNLLLPVPPYLDVPIHFQAGCSQSEVNYAMDIDELREMIATQKEGGGDDDDDDWGWDDELPEEDGADDGWGDDGWGDEPAAGNSTSKSSKTRRPVAPPVRHWYYLTGDQPTFPLKLSGDRWERYDEMTSYQLSQSYETLLRDQGSSARGELFSPSFCRFRAFGLAPHLTLINESPSSAIPPHESASHLSFIISTLPRQASRLVDVVRRAKPIRSLERRRDECHEPRSCKASAVTCLGLRFGEKAAMEPPRPRSSSPTLLNHSSS